MGIIHENIEKIQPSKFIKFAPSGTMTFLGLVSRVSYSPLTS